jgi:phospholipid transport system substrate-binding protein
MRVFLIACCTLLAVSAADAQDLAPDALVRSITEDVLAAVRQDKALQAGDARKFAALVEARVLPHFDFRRTTQIAMGANWRHASPEQQEELTREFRALLVRTYSSALASYRDQAVEYRPLRMRPGDTEVTVRTHISHILDKLHLANRVQATLYALRTGLTRLGNGTAEED